MSGFSMRRRALGAGTAAVLLSALFAVPAAAEAPLQLAQYYPAFPPPPGVYAPMPPHEVDAVVRSMGLRPVSPPRPEGPFFIVHAVGQGGVMVRVVVDRRSGRVSEVMRLSRDAPRMARMRPGWEPDPYDDFDEFDYDDDDYDDGVVLIPRGGMPPPGRGGYDGRETGPRVIERSPGITGSVPRSAAPGTADPLLGVPPQFRSQPKQSAPAQQRPRTAARPPASPRATPLPRPRPDDAPSVARTAPEVPAVTRPSKPDDENGETGRGSPGRGAADWPPAQGFE